MSDPTPAHSARVCQMFSNCRHLRGDKQAWGNKMELRALPSPYRCEPNSKWHHLQGAYSPFSESVMLQPCGPTGWPDIIRPMPQAGVWALQTQWCQLHNVASKVLRGGSGGWTRGGRRRKGRWMREWRGDKFLEEDEGDTTRTEKPGGWRGVGRGW